MLGCSCPCIWTVSRYQVHLVDLLVVRLFAMELLIFTGHLSALSPHNIFLWSQDIASVNQFYELKIYSNYLISDIFHAEYFIRIYF